MRKGVLFYVGSQIANWPLIIKNKFSTLSPASKTISPEMKLFAYKLRTNSQTNSFSISENKILNLLIKFPKTL